MELKEESVMEINNSCWITVSKDTGDVAPVFRKTFSVEKNIKNATLEITALGVYEADLNGQRVSDFVLAPGWTSYETRLQVQTYDVTASMGTENDLRVTVGRGWFRSPIPGWINGEDKKRRYAQPCGLIALLHIFYTDGTEEKIMTDESWQWGESAVRFSEIYDGERYDARFETKDWQPIQLLDWSKDILIPQEGEVIRETERVAARQVFRTPKGELMVDFGQEVTGYVEFTVNANAGDEVRFNHAEVMDKDGNFYNENYRGAKAEVKYICRDWKQTWHPHLTFFGFRYIHLISWPGEPKADQFTAIVVHSDMKRTGWLKSGDAELNQLFSNIVWGQRGNFLDVPTDCPQRDERLGWTGDAEAFCKAASYFYDVERFFKKWLRDLKADQYENGGVGHVIPNVLPDDPPGAAWGDAATIVPWQLYQTYGDKKVLEEQFDSMRKWVDCIPTLTDTHDLWTGCRQFGDWLGLDAPSGSYKGSSRDDFTASAFYANSIDLLIKAGRLLGKDMSAYEEQHRRTVRAFREKFPTYNTQTEHVLAIRFHLAEDEQKAADDLAALIQKDGVQLRTGFMGTPHILYALSDYGYADLAWNLLLRRAYPSWLYPVTKGATTVWEHWDGIKEDGSFWSKDMNSFNHYAYGAVADWVFENAAGLFHEEDKPGFAELIYAPHPDPRVGWLKARLDTRHGTISGFWACEKDGIRYELSTPVRTLVKLGGKAQFVEPGQYTFWTEKA